MNAPVYAAYGLTFQSDFECPEIPIIPGPPQVRIRRGPVPLALDKPRLTSPFFEASPGQLLLQVEGVGRYLIRHGEEVIIEPAPEATDWDIRAFLSGPAFGALLHQRGAFPLHASAVATRRGAVLLAGHSGLGKSTLLAALARRGHATVADDLSAITLDDAREPVVQFGWPHIKLWADAAARVGYAVAELTRVRAGVEKYLVPTPTQAVREALPLAAIYVLRADNGVDIRLEPYTGAASLASLRYHTFCRRYMEGLGMQGPHFKLAGLVARRVPIVCVTRPRSPFLLDELADRLEERLQ